jgi:hypothetical protein
MPRKPMPAAFSRIPVVFRVGTHAVKVSGGNGVWSYAVDDQAGDQSFATEAEAWEAGVREADRIDRASGAA